MMRRTHTCGELRKENAGQTVILSGWVHKYRNLGGMIFIDLRDRYGITQAMFDPKTVSEEIMQQAAQLRNEFVVTISGMVQAKPEANKKIATGEIGVIANAIQIENKSETPPFNFLDGKSDAKEDLRLEYRYIDLRSERMTKNLVLRHKVNMAIRNYLDDKNFVEYETPTFSKSTPEGARDYLIPSRLYPGQFFALPQSPQIYKQLLMVAGQDKYFQIARCYRDEDSRKDRQPEFTQIDIEQSFVTQDEIFNLAEGMVKAIFKAAVNQDIPTPFERIPYSESMELYGVDKPDLRFGLKLKNITDITRNSGFKVFTDAACVKFIAIPGLENLSRKQIAEYEDYAKHLGAKGLAFVKVVDGKLDGGCAKFLTEPEIAEILAKCELDGNGIIFFGADTVSNANKVLGNLRNRLAEELKLFNPDEFRFCWIVDFPMFEYSEEENRWIAMHHMFTMPKPEFLEDMKNERNLDKILGQLYDLVANGVELASGSIRIHNCELQEKVFSILGMSREEFENKFGFMLNAFKFGAPPHGGMAAGIDRLVQILCKEETIRDVMAFPKAKNQNCLMMNAPSTVDEAQLDELHIKIK